MQDFERQVAVRMFEIESQADATRIEAMISERFGTSFLYEALLRQLTQRLVGSFERAHFDADPSAPSCGCTLPNCPIQILVSEDGFELANVAIGAQLAGIYALSDYEAFIRSFNDIRRSATGDEDFLRNWHERHAGDL